MAPSAPTEAPPCVVASGSRTPRVRSALLMGFGMHCVFTCYSTAQNYASSLLHFDGLPLDSVMLVTAYVCFAMSSVTLGPWFVRRHGAHRAMSVAAVGYVVFVASLVYVITPLSTLAAAIMGMSAGMIWVGNGVYTSACAQGAAWVSGLNWGLVNGATMSGGLIGMVFFRQDSAGWPPGLPPIPIVAGWNAVTSPFFVALLCVGAVGWLCLASLAPIESEAAAVDGSCDIQRLGNAARHCWYLMPLAAFTGIVQTFRSGLYTRQLPIDLVGPVLVVLGFCELLGGAIVARAFDRRGKAAGTLVFLALQTAALAVSFLAGREGGAPAWQMFVGGALLGLADSGLCTLLYAELDAAFGKPAAGSCAEAEDRGFSNVELSSLFFLSQSFGFGVTFGVAPFALAHGQKRADDFMYLTEIALVGAWMVLSSVCFLLPAKRRACCAGEPLLL
eukprot:TRINITY_DN15550_c0_g1_i4.p1 TRINITY_DN15550_c0_g1~~TRINITY_DN15550_c0_g1_i4.p1  ORF type:complete len:446 (+),score=75.24 TRINITY_DN15550_c0_g1_i4:95-1432(+)